MLLTDLSMSDRVAVIVDTRKPGWMDVPKPVFLDGGVSAGAPMGSLPFQQMFVRDAAAAASGLLKRIVGLTSDQDAFCRGVVRVVC